MAPEEDRSKRSRFPTFRRLAGFLPRVGMGVGFLVAFVLIVSAVWNWRATVRLEKALDDTRAVGLAVTGEELNAYHRSQITGENAAKYYEAAFALMEDSEEQKALAYNLPLVGRNQPLPPLGEPFPPYILQAASQYLAGKKEFFDLMGKAAACESCVFDLDFTEGADLDFSHLGSARNATRLLLLSAFVEAGHGDLDKAVARLDQAFVLERHLRVEPTLLSALVRGAVGKMSVEAVERLLSTERFSKDQLKRLQNALASEMTSALWQYIFLGERAFAMSIFDECLYGGDPTTVFYLLNLSGTRLRPKGIGDELAARILRSLARGPIKDEYTGLLHFYTQVVNQASLSPRRARKWAQELSEDGMQRMGFSKHFVRMLVPAVAEAYDHVLTAHLFSAACETALAVERYRIATGQMPTNLQDLVPGYIQAIPEDYFGEGALKFKEFEQGYIVYSVGKDGQDDGGAEDKDEINTKECDLVFRVMR